MLSAQLREKYLTFFANKGCKRFPSSSLIPPDASMLLTSAGMVQFKPYFLQQKRLEPPYIGATTVQKCVRTTDIDIIGTTGRHLSFFEMLGNFSFGGYSKREMCAWAYEFATEILEMDKQRLYFTVYEQDDEAARIWAELGVAADHISRLGWEDNFWVAGATGPCGPSSELYYDQGLAFGCGRSNCAPGCDCDRFVEFWNCVFTQYDMQEDGSLVDLPTKNIDTGMGLERTVALLSGVHSNYETDMLRGLIKVGEELSGTRYTNSFVHDGEGQGGVTSMVATQPTTTAETLETPRGGVTPMVATQQQQQNDLSLRILADHSRAVTFMIGDGILPTNEGRGYVLRRLLRRAMRHGLLLGIEAPFLDNFVRATVDALGDVYPEIVENQQLIKRIVRAEEERFTTTLKSGHSYLDKHLAAARENCGPLSGSVAFELHDRFGFPIDLTVEIAGEQGVKVDTETFEQYMEKQRQRAREHADADAWTHSDALYDALLRDVGPTSFVGYNHHELTAEVLAIVVDGQAVLEIGDGEAAEVILDRTPFYGERGGQVGDTGTLTVYAGVDDGSDEPLRPLDAQSSPLEQVVRTIQDKPVKRDEVAVRGEVAAQDEVAVWGEAIERDEAMAPTVKGKAADGADIGTDTLGALVSVGSFDVTDTRFYAQGLFAHVGRIDGHLKVGDTVHAAIDGLRRERIERNHTATHLLHSALRQVLGEHIKQAGSLVAPERLRFDFTHFEPITDKQISNIEQLVNTRIMEDSSVSSHTTTLDAARRDGVVALFGEKYGEQVRVLEAGPNSRELCGGTHVSHTAQIGLFKIVSESSVGANLRRIEALTSFDALEYLNQQERELRRAAELLKVVPAELTDRLEHLTRHQRKLEAELARMRQNETRAGTEALLRLACDLNYRLLVTRVEAVGLEQLRASADHLRQQLGTNSAVVLGALTVDGAPLLLAAGTKEAVRNGFDAGTLVASIAPLINGRGGGKSQMAQAGGKDAQGLDAALAEARRLLGVQESGGV
ncbi:MAG: alanine--tRNA ligase [Coriobacteriales bacterium]|jgi:alanyl-tRNA synthetase|nr:alanine--tRNA ligase [Coriobacteriales bacterium]